jgi:hypothetical protein
MAFKFRVPTLEECWQRVKSRHWIGDCPTDDGRHQWIYNAARGCFFDGLITMEQAEDLIRHELTRHERPGEIAHAVRQAYGRAYASSSDGRREQAAEYAPQALAERASRVPAEVNSDWLRDHSPMSVDLDSPGEFIESGIYARGERVMVVNRLNEWKGYIWEVGLPTWPRNQYTELEAYLEGIKEGAWFHVCPITGTEINKSYRSEANITSFRYVLMESDKAPKDLWIRLLAQLPVPIVAIYDSGGKSIHALVRVPASSGEELREEIKHCKRKFVPLGLDDKSNRVVQLTRLPGVLRWHRDKVTGRVKGGAFQRLLWLNPNANGSPIWIP